MSEAKIRISMIQGTFELEGSEAFVSAQIEKFADVIKASLSAPYPTPVNPNPGSGIPSNPMIATFPTTPQDLAEVFAANENGVQILKDVPGDSKPEKTVNAAKLYLFGLQALKQRDTALFEEIKSVCKIHGFYDSGNMAAYLKDDQESFIFGGSGKKQTLKLTVPGTKSAGKLIEGLKAGSKE
jgi:hypothetical protein